MFPSKSSLEIILWCIMSSDKTTTEAADNCCASCGIAEVDDIKLVPCDDCDIVNYCSDECQRYHRSEHELECKERATELRDELLFKQPEGTHFGDCPICCLPFPLDPLKSRMQTCCSKAICIGCAYSSIVRHWEEKRLRTCPFCRHIVPDTQEEADRRLMKRVEANDPAAIRKMGGKHFDEGDYDGAFKYWTKAAELGNVEAHYELSIMYRDEECVEKDEKKEIYHLEEAAIGGHASARQNLGVYEERNGRIDRTVKHLIIAANLGLDSAMKGLKECYKDGIVSKDDFAAALRGHYAAVEATKSPEREAAAKFYAAL